jgi:hypothetical protein
MYSADWGYVFFFYGWVDGHEYADEIVFCSMIAIDVWSAGVILLFFLSKKFPIFQSNDDIEGLMEIAVIIGKRKIERAATLHGKSYISLFHDLSSGYS